MRRRKLLLFVASLFAVVSGCDLLGDDPTDAERFVDQWTIDRVTISVDGEARDVTSQVLEGVEEASVTFEGGETFELELVGSDGQVTRSGTFSLDAEAKTLALTPRGASEAGTFSYRFEESGRLRLTSENVAFLTGLMNVNVSVESVDRATLVLQRME